MLVYNEIYCDSQYTQQVEETLERLMKEHPEWMIDFSKGEGNWETAEDM